MGDKTLGQFPPAALPLLGTDLIAVSRGGVLTKYASIADILAFTATVQAACEAAEAGAEAAEAVANTAKLAAAAAAAAAASSAGASATSATNAAASATLAGTLAGAAATSSTAAGASATTAGNSATAAAGSATTAGTNATAANASAVAGAASAAAAATSETNAGASATSASSSASTAVENAIATSADRASAAASKLGAEDAEDNAVAANTAAQGYAATAKRVSIYFTFDSSTTDGDPGNGLFRLNNPTPSSVTKLFFDLLDASGGDQTAWIGAFDDSTNTTHRGTLILIDSTNAANWAIYAVTGANEDVTGYRKVNVTYVGNGGSFVAGRAICVNFARTGNKGADGAGAGDVVGPAGATDGYAALFDGATGKLIKSAGFAPQAANSNLGALAGVTSAANKLFYFTGSGAGAVADFTAAGRALVDDADAAAQRVTLSLGNVDNTSDTTKWAATATLTNKTINLSNNTLTGTLAQFNAALSDGDFASQAYVDALLAANDAMVFKGVINASTNPNYPAADAGHTYRISVPGKIGGGSGPNVEVGDLLTCTVDSTAAGTQASVGANWNIVQSNLDGAVIGPASVTDGHAAIFDGISGKLIKTAGFAPQPVDATLTSFAALTIAANSITIGTGADAFSQVTFGANSFPARASTGNLVAKTVSDFGLSFIDDADQTTARATLGVVIGTNVQAWDSDLDAFAALTPANDDFVQRKAGAWVNRTVAQVVTDLQGDGTSSSAAGHRGVPVTDRSANYTLTAADNGKATNHPSTDTTARNVTAFANMPGGFTHTVINEVGAGVISIVPDASQTMYLAGVGSTGTRTLAAGGMATLIVNSSGKVMISGLGLT